MNSVQTWCAGTTRPVAQTLFSARVSLWRIAAYSHWSRSWRCSGARSASRKAVDSVKANLEFPKMANLEFPSSNVLMLVLALLVPLGQLSEHTSFALLAQPVALAADVDGG